MGAGFYNYRDTKQYNLISESENDTHNLNNISIVCRFRLKSLSGTSQTSILTNEGYFDIRRKLGTTAEFEVLITNASGSTSVLSLGVLSINTDYVVIMKGSALNRTLHLNSTLIGSYGLTGNTWNPGSNKYWTLGPSDTTIDIEIYEVAFYDASVTNSQITNFVSQRFIDSRSTNLQGYYNFNIEYYGTFNSSDSNCSNAGLSSTIGRLTPTKPVGSWTGDDPIIPTANINININNALVSSGSSIVVKPKLHETISIDFINSNLSNSGEIIVIDGLDLLPIIVPANTTINKSISEVFTAIIQVTLYGKGRIFNELDSIYSFTIDIRPINNDVFRVLESIKVSHIRGYG